MSARKTLTLTTLSMEEPASVRTARRFAMIWRVLSVMEPVTRAPSGVAGIWPLRKMAKGVLMAWDCGT
ncbi:hypothetical protein BN1708_015172 [Verticillium longisporum]|uniref:Uncharacterized protein n=1 Tax=Verticillium longisporum TaxID=100787 RepID=A0A0G4M1X9_VERLO|nr:hypothetical protein BN1708_015172 [Verticillium longisporum]